VLPSVDINLLRTGYGGTLTRRATDFFGNPIENPESDWVYNSNTSQGVSLNWTIRGTSLFDARARQDRTNTGRRLQLAARGWALEAEVRRRFFDALEQRELLSVEEAIRGSREVDLESARRLFEIAQRSRVDVLTAELQVERQELNVQEQLRRYDQAVLGLRTYLGDPELEEVHPVAEDVLVFDPSALDGAALVELALRANPTLRETESTVAGARLGVREARQNWFPTLNLSFDYGRLAQTREAEAFLDLAPDESEMQSSFSVFVSLPAFNSFFQDRAEQARAQVELDNQQETLRERRLEVERQVRTELINLDNQYRALGLATRSLEIAGEAVRLAREEYRLGTRTFEQLQETVTQEADARRQVIQARFGFMDALLALEEAVGERVGPGLAGGR
ncbi:MAG TPA: TolC family protein, partial [Longimicrobiales bacterium]|nr:TolC family protein [Longimicrobiales bacterium]